MSAAVLIALSGCSSTDSPSEVQSAGGQGGARANGSTGGGGASGGSAGSTLGGSAPSATGGATSSPRGGTGASATGGDTSRAGSAGGEDTATGGVSGSDGGASGAGGEEPDRECLGPDIDILAPTVTGTLTVNGAAMTDDGQGAAELFLLGESGDRAALAHIPGSAFSTVVAAGTYALYYSSSAGSDIPTNTGANVRSAIVVGDSPVALDIDIAGTTVSGSLTVNGSPITEEYHDFGMLELRDADGDRARLSNTNPPGDAYSVSVAPGTYDLYYHALDKSRSIIPSNVAGKLRSGIVVGDSPAELDIDIPATTVSVSVTVAGAPLSDVSMVATFLTLKNDVGDEAKLTVTSESGASTTPVIPGTYDLYYSAHGTGDDVPKNSSVEIRSGIVVEGSQMSIAVDVPATVVSGRVTVNGAALSAPEGEAVLALSGQNGDEVDISVDAAGAFRVVVVPGTYDLVYSRPNQVDGAPVNGSTKLQRAVVIGDSAMTLDVDIPVTTVSGRVTLNGETVTGASDQGDGGGYLFLADADGAQAMLSTLLDGSFSTLVIRGSYDLYYGSFDGSAGRAPNVPINRRAKLKEGITVGEAPLALDWDVEAVRVAGTVVVNGVAIPNPDFGVGEVFLEGPDGDSGRLALTSSESTDPNDLATGAYSAWVIPGSYELYYRAYNGRGAVIPTNSRAHLGCFDVRR